MHFQGSSRLHPLSALLSAFCTRSGSINFQAGTSIFLLLTLARVIQLRRIKRTQFVTETWKGALKIQKRSRINRVVTNSRPLMLPCLSFARESCRVVSWFSTQTTMERWSFVNDPRRIILCQGLFLIVRFHRQDLSFPFQFFGSRAINVSTPSVIPSLMGRFKLTYRRSAWPELAMIRFCSCANVDLRMDVTECLICVVDWESEDRKDTSKDAFDPWLLAFGSHFPLCFLQLRTLEIVCCFHFEDERSALWSVVLAAPLGRVFLPLCGSLPPSVVYHLLHYLRLCAVISLSEHFEISLLHKQLMRFCHKQPIRTSQSYTFTAPDRSKWV